MPHLTDIPIKTLNRQGYESNQDNNEISKSQRKLTLGLLCIFPLFYLIKKKSFKNMA